MLTYPFIYPNKSEVILQDLSIAKRESQEKCIRSIEKNLNNFAIKLEYMERYLFIKKSVYFLGTGQHSTLWRYSHKQNIKSLPSK